MAIRFLVKHEYIDRILDRRVKAGEELELDADRVNAIQALGVGLEPIRDDDAAETATAPPAGEKAVTGRAKRP